MRLTRPEPGALIASVLAHAVIAALGVWFWSTHEGPGELPEEVEIEWQEPPPTAPPVRSIGSGTPQAVPRRATAPEITPPGGGAVVPRPDVGDPGRGGDRRGEHASNLSSSIDPLTLERDPLNHLRKSEVQRLATARKRRSLDDRRATPHPMELDFVASGRGTALARRVPSEAAASGGVRLGQVPVEAGSVAGADPGDGAPSQLGGSVEGGAPVATLGVPGAPRTQQATRESAVMTARPMVPQDRAAVPAAERAPASDTVDSHQRVASRVSSLLQSSTLGGSQDTGAGGELGPRPAAAGGEQGAGSRAAPGGYGPGPLRDLAQDPGLQGFYRRVLGRLDEVLRDAFPYAAAAEGKGGLVVFDLTLRDDGQVASVAVVRPSGIDEYDRNVVRGVRKAGSFGRVPPAFGERAVLRISWDSMNPVVGRHGPGPGRRPQ